MMMYDLLKKRISNEFLLVVVSQLVTLLGGIFTIKILSIWMKIESYGDYMLLNGALAFMMTLPITAFLQGVSRYTSNYISEGYEQCYVNSIFIDILIVFILWTVIGGVTYIFGLYSNEMILCLVLLFPTEALKVTVRNLNNAKRDRRLVSFSVIIEFSTKIIGIILLSQFFNVTLFSVVVVLTASNLLSLIIGLRGLEFGKFNNLNSDFFRTINRKIVIFSFPLVIWGGFLWMRDMSSRFYLDSFVDQKAVAIYAMTVSLGMILPNAIQGIIGSFLLPIMYEREEKKPGFTWKISKYVSLLLTVFYFVSFCIIDIYSSDLVLLFTSVAYLDSATMLSKVFLLFALNSIVTTLSFDIYAGSKTHYLLFANIAPGLISAVLGWFFIKDYGISGAYITLIITYLCYSLFVLGTIIYYRGLRVHY